MVSMAICVVAMVGVALWLLRTRTGKAIRAVSDNPDLASSTGINTDRIILIVWVVGAALAGLGGILLGLEQQVRWDMGFSLLLLMFAAITLGGLGNPFGALVGGVVDRPVRRAVDVAAPGRHRAEEHRRPAGADPHPAHTAPGHPGYGRNGWARRWTGHSSSPTPSSRRSASTPSRYALIAQGLNVHFGYTGLLNFGQAAFAAAGAYAIAIPVSRYGWSFWACIPVVITAAVVLALLLGIPTLRLRADYLAIVTIAASEIVRISLNSVRFTWLTGGNDGLQKFTGDVERRQPAQPPPLQAVGADASTSTTCSSSSAAGSWWRWPRPTSTT